MHIETITESHKKYNKYLSLKSGQLWVIKWINDWKIIHEPGNFLGKTRRWWNDGYNKFDMSGYTLLGIGFGLRLWSFLETEDISSFSRLIEPGQCYLTLGKNSFSNHHRIVFELSLQFNSSDYWPSNQMQLLITQNP